jgi:hypothetical protein
MYYMIIIAVLLFLVYGHISAEYVPGNCTEVYSVDYVSNANLQTACNTHCPLVFTLGAGLNPSIYDDVFNSKEITPPAFPPKEILHKYRLPVSNLQSLSTLAILESHFAPKISGTVSFQEITAMSPPSDVVRTSESNISKLRAHTFSRWFMYVHAAPGQDIGVKVRMTQWNHVNFSEFNKYSQRNAGDYSVSCFHAEAAGTGEVYDTDKTSVFWNDPSYSFIEFNVQPGQFLYIPPYTWWSIQYTNPEIITCDFVYRTPINMAAHCWEPMLSQKGQAPSTNFVRTGSDKVQTSGCIASTSQDSDRTPTPGRTAIVGSYSSTEGELRPFTTLQKNEIVDVLLVTDKPVEKCKEQLLQIVTPLTVPSNLPLLPPSSPKIKPDQHPEKEINTIP